METTTPNPPRSYLQYIPLILLSSPSTIPLHLISAALDVDALHLTLGCQTPLSPSLLNNGEFPACAAMTTGYVFRVENEATVHFLQSIGTTGALTHLKVFNPSSERSGFSEIASFIAFWIGKAFASAVIFMLLFTGEATLDPLIDIILALAIAAWVMFTPSGHQAPVLTATLSSIMNICVALFMHEIAYRGSSHSAHPAYSSRPFEIALCGLFASRIIFAYVLSQRTKAGWYGASEPGVKGSLLVLLSRDRWVRLDGDVDDLKAVTSGTWLQPVTGFQETLSQLSCLLIWMSVLVGMAAKDGEKVVLVVMVLLRHMMTVWKVRQSNLRKSGMIMQGRKIEVDGSKGETGVKKYRRRLEMADELIEEFGRRDWAEKMGMVKPAESGAVKEVIM